MVQPIRRRKGPAPTRRTSHAMPSCTAASRSTSTHPQLALTSRKCLGIPFSQRSRYHIKSQRGTPATWSPGRIFWCYHRTVSPGIAFNSWPARLSLAMPLPHSHVVQSFRLFRLRHAPIHILNQLQRCIEPIRQTLRLWSSSRILWFIVVG